MYGFVIYTIVTLITYVISKIIMLPLIVRTYFIII